MQSILLFTCRNQYAPNKKPTADLLWIRGYSAMSLKYFGWGGVILLPPKFQGMICQCPYFEPLSQDCVPLGRPPELRVLLWSHTGYHIFSHHPIAEKLTPLYVLFYIILSPKGCVKTSMFCLIITGANCLSSLFIWECWTKFVTILAISNNHNM